MPVINVGDYFQTSPSFTDVVSGATDSFAAVRAMHIAVQQTTQAGDVINASGALWSRGDEQAYVAVPAQPVEVGTAVINVLRAPNMGSWVALKSDNLRFADASYKEDGIAFLESQGFQTKPFYTS